MSTYHSNDCGDVELMGKCQAAIRVEILGDEDIKLAFTLELEERLNMFAGEKFVAFLGPLHHEVPHFREVMLPIAWCINLSGDYREKGA